MSREVTYETQYKTIQKAYLNATDITCLVPIGINRARVIAREIKEEMESEGKPSLSDKLFILPTDRVLKKLGLSRENIERNFKNGRLLQ